MSKKLTIDYPDNLPDLLQLSQEEFEKEALRAMVLKLYELKKITSGTAAALLGIDRVRFILMLKEFGVSYMNISTEEFLSDLEK